MDTDFQTKCSARVCPAKLHCPPMRSRSRSHHRFAFTLIELLVVIGIVAVLLGLLLPTLSRVRESANTVKCAAQLRQIGQAIIGYASGNGGMLPAWSGSH